MNNNEMHHIYVGRRHNKTLKTVEQYRVGKRVRKSGPANSIFIVKYQSKIPTIMNRHLNNEGQECKTLCLGEGTSERRRVNKEGEYG
jgi:hypothetical protein